MSDELLEELGRIAREDAPPPLAEGDLDAMIAAALQSEEPAERAPAPERSKTRWWWAAAAVALLALGGGYLLGERSVDLPQEKPPLEARLPSGDVLTATAGARFEVLEPGPVVRRLELREGHVLFDVEPLGAEGRFEVRTPDGIVRVRGTVFSVEAGERTTVRVYEGQVEVERAGTTTSLGAGEMWRAGERVAWDSGELADEAAEAVAARARVASAAGAGDPDSALGSRESALGSRESALGSRESALGSRGSALGSRGSASASAENEDEDEGRGSEHDYEHEQEHEAGRRSRASESASASASASARPTRDDVRRWLADGDYERARRVSATRGWTLLEADALRALGRHADAAERYDRVARRGDGTAAYEAARLRFQRLGDARGALASLRSAEAPPALGERALGLEARLLLRLGQPAGARTVAERYLERYPNGGLASWMAQLRDGAE